MEQIILRFVAVIRNFETPLVIQAVKRQATRKWK